MITEPSALYAKLAKTHGIEVEHIKDLMFFVWRTGVREAVIDFKSPEIYIQGLGSFKVKGYKLKYTIPQVQNMEKKPELLDHYERLLSNLTRVQSELDSIAQDKAKFDEAKHSRDIRKQEQDMGGTEEQTIQEGTC